MEASDELAELPSCWSVYGAGVYDGGGAGEATTKVNMRERTAMRPKDLINMIEIFVNNTW